MGHLLDRLSDRKGPIFDQPQPRGLIEASQHLASAVAQSEGCFQQDVTIVGNDRVHVVVRGQGCPN
ncbi:hypothetical protein RQ832_28795, partial [Roseomonas sp. DSM 102946]|nr:hypothetical protein [Roseomonas sp. DSM 102946]